MSAFSVKWALKNIKHAEYFILREKKKKKSAVKSES